MSDAAAPPQVWVDADACPGPVKDILFRAAERAQVQVTLIANQWLRTPPSRFIRALQVQGGFDVADVGQQPFARQGRVTGFQCLDDGRVRLACEVADGAVLIAPEVC